MRRRSDEQQALVVKQDQEVDGLLRAGLQEEALAAQDRLNQARLTAAKLTEQVERLEAQYAELAEAQGTAGRAGDRAAADRARGGEPGRPGPGQGS